MKKILIALIMITLSLFGMIQIADAAEPEERMVNCYFKGQNPAPIMMRVVNQYQIGSIVDWSNASADGRAEFTSAWPHVVGTGVKSDKHSSTKYEVDVETGEVHFNLKLTQSERERLPADGLDTPNFTVQCDDEYDNQDPPQPLPVPTFKSNLYDVDNNVIGTYDKTVTRMQ